VIYEIASDTDDFFQILVNLSLLATMALHEDPFGSPEYPPNLTNEPLDDNQTTLGMALVTDEGLNIMKLPNETSARTISSLGLFAMYLEILLLLYTVVPLPLYGTLTLGMIYSGNFVCYSQFPHF